MSTIRFQNPANGYVEEAYLPGLWCFLFGPLYFASKGIWSHAIISFVLVCATFGVAWLIYPFWAKRIVEASYLRKGWQRVESTAPLSVGTANPSFKAGYRFAQKPVRWLIGAVGIVLLITIISHRERAVAPPDLENGTIKAAAGTESPSPTPILKTAEQANAAPATKNATGNSAPPFNGPVTFRGLTLSQPLSIRKCNESIHQPTCWVQTDPLNCPGKIVVRLGDKEGNAFSTQLAVNICIYVINGKLAEISQITFGIEHQDQILDLLESKFGMPTAIATSKVQNRMGARFDVIAAEWKLHDLEVEFTGASTDLNHGEISITTPEFRAYAKEHIKPKPGL